MNSVVFFATPRDFEYIRKSLKVGFDAVFYHHQELPGSIFDAPFSKFTYGDLLLIPAADTDKRPWISERNRAALKCMIGRVERSFIREGLLRQSALRADTKDAQELKWTRAILAWVKKNSLKLNRPKGASYFFYAFEDALKWRGKKGRRFGLADDSRLFHGVEYRPVEE